MTNNSCPLCNKKSSETLYNRVVDFDFCDSFHQSISWCQDCDLIFLEDNESYCIQNLNNYYSAIHRTPCNLVALGDDDPRVKNAKQRLDFVTKHKSSGNYLEIGIGDGVSLYQALKSGFTRVTGYEFSESYSDTYQYLNDMGASIEFQNIYNLKTKEKYDVISLFLVLEHIKDPLTLFQNLSNFLSPGGLLFIEVPDVKSYSNSYSDNMLTHEHLFHYSIDSLEKVARKAKYEMIDSKSSFSYGFSLIAAFSKGLNLSSKDSYQPKISQEKTNKDHFVQYLKNLEAYKESTKVVLNDILQIEQNIAVFGIGEYWINITDGFKDIYKHISLLIDDTPSKLNLCIENRVIKNSLALKDFDGTVLIAVPSFEEMIAEKILNLNPTLKVRKLNSEILSRLDYEKAEH
jgi:2-polyprenyl-3-methyl-5-hydroxy-6-metoxy-1,4-benzoquinol methylase